MKGQLSLEAIVTLSMFILVLGVILLKISMIVSENERINDVNNELYLLVYDSEEIVGDWIITNFTCPDFYVKLGNVTCGTPGDLFIDRYAICNNTICKVIVG